MVEIGAAVHRAVIRDIAKQRFECLMFRVWIVIVVDDKNGSTYRKLSTDGLTVYPNIKCLHLCLTYSPSLSSMWSYLKLVRGAGAQISQKFHLLPQNGWLVQKVHFWGPTPLLKILLMGLKLIEDCIEDIFQMIDMIVFKFWFSTETLHN